MSDLDQRNQRPRSPLGLVAVALAIGALVWGLAQLRPDAPAPPPIEESAPGIDAEDALPDDGPNPEVEALRVLAQTDAERASRRARQVLEGQAAPALTRQALSVLLDTDPGWAAPEIVRRARMEDWSEREQVIASYAPLLLRVDGGEERMLVRSALLEIAADPIVRDEFVAALRRKDTAAGRRGLAADFIREAENYENAVQGKRPMYGRQTFFLRCHLACGGTLETFAGWLHTVLSQVPDAADERDRMELIRTIQAALGIDVLRGDRPTPAELDAATAKILGLLPR